MSKQLSHCSPSNVICKDPIKKIQSIYENPVFVFEVSTLTLAGCMFMLAVSTVTLAMSTVTLTVSTVAFAVSTVALAMSTVTLAVSMVTLAMSTVTLAGRTLTLAGRLQFFTFISLVSHTVTLLLFAYTKFIQNTIFVILIIFY